MCVKYIPFFQSGTFGCVNRHTAWDLHVRLNETLRAVVCRGNSVRLDAFRFTPATLAFNEYSTETWILCMTRLNASDWTIQLSYTRQDLCCLIKLPSHQLIIYSHSQFRNPKPTTSLGLQYHSRFVATWIFAHFMCVSVGFKHARKCGHFEFPIRQYPAPVPSHPLWATCKHAVKRPCLYFFGFFPNFLCF